MMSSVWARRGLFAGLSVVVLAAFAGGGFALHARRVAALQQVPAPEKFPWALRTAEVKRHDLTAGFPVLATLSSQAEIVIIPQISGVIRRMGPREGEPVRKDLLLVRIDTQELVNQIAALSASYQAAKGEAVLREKELRRKQALLPKGFATQEAVDQLRTALQTARQRVKQLRGEVDALRTRLKYGTIRSPVDGVIAARLQEPGDLAAPGRAVYRITATTGAKIRVTVPQAVAARLRKGSEIRLDLGGQSLTVWLSRVFPSLDALSMGSAEADLGNIPFGLPSGSRVPGRVILDRWPGALVVPRTAIVLASDGQSGTIFRVVAARDGNPGRLRRIKVKIIASGREGVAISGAVSEGDRVAIAQETELLKLKDGDPVLPEFGRER
jgi:membrane fusion protein, multidrug efflux system